MDSPAVDNGRPSGAPLIIGLVVVILAAGAIGFAAWRATQPQVIPLGDIAANIRQWDGQQVLVEGTVSNPTNLYAVKFFILTDESGSMPIVTERGLPADGSTARVNGHVKQMFEVAGLEQTVIFELAGKDK
jgi:hypothetical protein